MDINYLNFQCNIYGVNIRGEIILGEAERYLDKKLISLYNRDTIIKYSIGCKDENQEDPIYFELRVFDRNSGKVYYLYFILKTTMENINQNIYQIIEEKIREEARNNIYSEEDKEVLKIFIEKYSKRTKEEIADIFNKKEKVINQPEIIIPQIVEQEPIVSADIDIEAGLIDPKREPKEFYYSKLNNRGASITSRELFFNIIKDMYSSSAIDGTRGEISENNLYYDYIIPFSKVKNIYLSDFHFIDYYSKYSKKDVDEYDYILFCIYEKLKDCPYFVRYLARIVVDKDSNMTVQDAVNNYYDSISGRVSSRYQKSIEAFQKKYR